MNLAEPGISLFLGAIATLVANVFLFVPILLGAHWTSGGNLDWKRIYRDHWSRILLIPFVLASIVVYTVGWFSTVIGDGTNLQILKMPTVLATPRSIHVAELQNTPWRITSVTDTPAPTATVTSTPTPIPTDTPTSAPTSTSTPTPTPTFTVTPLPSPTPTPPCYDWLEGFYFEQPVFNAEFSRSGQVHIVLRLSLSMCDTYREYQIWYVRGNPRTSEWKQMSDRSNIPCEDGTDKDVKIDRNISIDSLQPGTYWLLPLLIKLNGDNYLPLENVTECSVKIVIKD